MEIINKDRDGSGDGLWLILGAIVMLGGYLLLNPYDTRI